MGNYFGQMMQQACEVYSGWSGRGGGSSSKINKVNKKNDNNETSILLICSNNKVESNLYMIPLQPVRITCCRCL